MSSPRWAVDSTPPPGLTFLNALQHVALSAVTLIFPRLVAEAAGADAETTIRYVGLAMVATGISTLIQGWGRKGVGSGYLLLGHCTILYVPFATSAAATGGLGAVAGMTIVAGLTEMALSRGVRLLRRWISPEIVGVVIMQLGIALGTLGLKLVFGIGPAVSAGGLANLASVVTLGTISVLAVWGSATLRPLAVLVGVAVGCAAYVGLQLLSGDAHASAGGIAMIAPRWPLALPVVRVEYLAGFLVGALACFVRATADLTTCQLLAQPNRQAPDFRSLRAGTLADGLGTVIAGCLGVLGTNTYTGSVGLATATDVHSRTVGLVAGAMWIVLGIVPGIASALVAIPAGIFGAACFYSALFTIRAGVSMLAMRLIDTRRTIVIGAAIVISVLAHDVDVHLHKTTLLGQLLQSPLSVSMLAALALNALLRLGLAKEARLQWRPADGPAPLVECVDSFCEAWAVSVELARRARNFAEEFAALALALLPADGVVDVTQHFDETGVRLVATWLGPGLDPDAVANPDAQDGGLELALMRHWAHELRIERRGGQQRLVFFLDEG